MKSLPVVLLLIGLIAVCLPKDLTEKQIKTLTKLVATWDAAPPVDEFVGGNFTKEGNLSTFHFQYMSDDGKECNATYVITIDPDKGIGKKHKFECIQLPAPEEEDFD